MAGHSLDETGSVMDAVEINLPTFRIYTAVFLVGT